MPLQKVKKKSCTILISITIALEHLQQDHLTSIFPLGREGQNLLERGKSGSRTNVIDSIQLL